MARDIIADIDAAIGCQQCRGPLGGSPSGDFCCEEHQRDWHAARSDRLIGYREPDDLAAHVLNQPELHSRETTPGVGTYRRDLSPVLPVTVTAWPPNAVLVTFDPAAFGDDMFFVLTEDGRVVELRDVQVGRTDERPVDPMERALELRRRRNTGPQRRHAVPRRIDPHRGR